MTEKGYLIKKKVLFIDLDDTIITTISGNTFPTDVTDFKIRKEVLDKIVDAFPTLYYVEIVSNQGGIPQFVDEQDFTDLTDFFFVFSEINKSLSDVSTPIGVCFTEDFLDITLASSVESVRSV